DKDFDERKTCAVHAVPPAESPTRAALTATTMLRAARRGQPAILHRPITLTQQAGHRSIAHGVRCFAGFPAQPGQAAKITANMSGDYDRASAHALPSVGSSDSSRQLVARVRPSKAGPFAPLRAGSSLRSG